MKLSKKNTLNNNTRKTRKNSSKKNTIHKILGPANPTELELLLNKFNKLWDSISIKKNYKSQFTPIFMGSTIPHAGFMYSGLFALFAIKEVIGTNTPNTIYILWFKHNKSKKEEHSLINVKTLVKLLYPNITIKTIEVDEHTQLENLPQLKLQKDKNIKLLVSTDFSHYNYGSAAPNMNILWENDSIILENQDIVWDKVERSPCGHEPLRLYKQWMRYHNLNQLLLGYSNSTYMENWWHNLKNEPFNGVSYASLVAMELPRNKRPQWFTQLNSKFLAYSHVKCVDDFLNTNITGFSSELFWSPLRNMVGSCFVTINDRVNKTYSCFGAWETQNDNLLECIKSATQTVQRASWNSHLPVTPDVIKSVLKGKYSISVTLIQPIKMWKIINLNTPINKRKKNRGYVYYNNKINKVGMTYLPSVWESYKQNSIEFFKGLQNKHMGNYPATEGWSMRSYESISWIITI